MQLGQGQSFQVSLREFIKLNNLFSSAPITPCSFVSEIESHETEN